MDFFIIMSAEIFIGVSILISAVIIGIVQIIIRRSKCIETVTKSDRVLFKVYQTANTFIVKDYTLSFVKKIKFKTYVDVEAFIKVKMSKLDEE